VASDKVAEATAAPRPSTTEAHPGLRLHGSGLEPHLQKVRSAKLFDKLDFLSLMIALFCGTASLPHILIRYYTVKTSSAPARAPSWASPPSAASTC